MHNAVMNQIGHYNSFNVNQHCTSFKGKSSEATPQNLEVGEVMVVSNGHNLKRLPNGSFLDVDLTLTSCSGRNFPADSFPGLKHEIYLGRKVHASNKNTDVVCLSGNDDFTWRRPPFIDDKYCGMFQVSDYKGESRKYIDNFVKAIQNVQDGNSVICAHNESDAEDFLLLNDFFNPKSNGETAFDEPPIYMQAYKYSGIKNLYKNLTADDKKALGWDSDYEKQFLQKLYKTPMATW